MVTEKKVMDILLAEDDNDDVLIFETALKETEVLYELRHAKNGDQLFVLLKEHIPYILFLDINMPCKDGAVCLKEIRNTREYDHLPIIMYTSNLMNKVIDDCFASGANLFLQKAFTFNTLADNLRKIFSIDWEDYMHYPSRNNFVLS